MRPSLPPITKILMGLSFIGALIITYWPGLSAFGAHNTFLQSSFDGPVGMGGFWGQVVIQMGAYTFLHGGLLHFFSNALFLYLFGGPLEERMGRGRYISFFVFSTLFTGALLIYFSNVPVIGISGFCMGVLTYTLLIMKQNNNPQYQSALLLLVINIGIGFQGNISFWGHALGAVSGLLFYLFNRK